MSTEIIYGINPVLEALAAGKRRCHQLFIAAGRKETDARRVEEEAARRRIPVRHLPREEIAQMAGVKTHQGIVAYSKICTHVGCPVGLYEQGTHHLLCPCHQSTFDVTQDCAAVFGPAKRALPQLKIGVDDEGYLIATQGFMEPVGPSFWERG